MEMTRRHDRLHVKIASTDLLKHLSDECLNSEQISHHLRRPPDSYRMCNQTHGQTCTCLLSVIFPCDVSASQDRSCSGDWMPAWLVHGPVLVRPSGLFAHLSPFDKRFDQCACVCTTHVQSFLPQWIQGNEQESWKGNTRQTWGAVRAAVVGAELWMQ